MDVYDRLGVRKVVNGAATLTRLGGSLMPPEVLEAMALPLPIQFKSVRGERIVWHSAPDDANWEIQALTLSAAWLWPPLYAVGAAAVVLLVALNAFWMKKL